MPPTIASADTAGPSIVSDQADYAPGSTVTITGSDWPAGDTVHLTVDDSDGRTWHYAADPVSDESGGFADTFVLPDWFVANYTATAADDAGNTATTTFTDSNVQVRAANASGAIAVPIAWTLYKKNSNCTGAAQPNGSGTVTTPDNGNGYQATTGLANSASESLSAPTTVTIGTELYAFSEWTGPASGTNNRQCVPGNADNGVIKELATYVDAGRATKLEQTITFNALDDKTFGASDFTISATASSGLAVSFSAEVGSQCTVTGATVHLTGAGTCTIDATQAGDDTYYAATPVTQSFDINSAAIAVTVGGSQVYASSAPTFTTAETLPFGVTLSGNVTCTAVTSGLIDNTLAVGSYTIAGTTCSGLAASDPNYSINYIGGSFTVGPATITVTVTGTSTYGTAPSFDATVSPDGAPVSGTVSCAKTIDGASIDAALPAGTYSIDPMSCGNLSSDANHAIVYVGGSYIVTQADLAVMVTGSQTYGASSPSFTGSVELPVGVTIDTSKLTCTTVDDGTAIDHWLQASPAHTIDAASCGGVSLGGDNGSSYEIVYGGGAFVVNPASLSVDVSGTQVYGGAATWSVGGYHGLVNSDTSSVVTGPLSCEPIDASLHVGAYAITGCSGLTADNYSIAYNPGELTVTPRPVTVSVNGTQVYGGDPQWQPDYAGTGFTNNDTSAVVTDDLICQPNDPTLAANNSYQITSCSGLSADDYTFSYTLGLLTVSPRPITVQVAGTQVYGGSPVYSPDYTDTEFANGEKSTVVQGSLTCSTSATTSSPVGDYSISGCSGLTSSNYSIDYSYGLLSVTPKPISVTVNGTQVYGGANRTFTPDYNGVGWVGSDGSGLVTGTLTCDTGATAWSGVGSAYTVSNCSGLSAPNYTITLVGGTFTVTPAQLTVTADDKSMTYGDAVPALTYQITGFVNGETLATSGVTGTPTCSTSATSARPAGTYPITCATGSLAASNYSFSFTAGTLTIATRNATLGYTGNLFWSTGSATGTTASVTLQGVLTPAPGGNPDLTKGAPIVFDLYKSTNLSMTNPDATCSASTVSSAGVATCNLPTLGVDNWTVVMDLDVPGSTYFTAQHSDPVVLTVYQPTTDKFATGGGWVTDPSGSAANSHGNLGFTVRYAKNGTASGQSVYVYRGSDGYDYVVKSNSWNGGGLSFGPSSQTTGTVSFSAKCNVTVIDRSTGLQVPGLGGGNYTFRVDALDNGSPGSSDTYAISVYSPTGTLFHQAGTTGSQLTLGGGNVVVHTK